jgi:hypothetical protein
VRVADLHARDLTWRPAPAVWPDARPVVAAAIAHLPHVTDDDAAALIEHLALAVADREAELRAVRTILSAALAEAHDLGVELRRTRDRYHRLLDARRAVRQAAA